MIQIRIRHDDPRFESNTMIHESRIKLDTKHNDQTQIEPGGRTCPRFESIKCHSFFFKEIYGEKIWISFTP